jgi:hypothetical protein
MFRAIPKARPAPATLETLTLLARCPECGHAPNLRITPAERDAAIGQTPDLMRATYGCHTRGCRTVYVLTAWHYQRAYAAGAAIAA